ncbi:conserved hypothetical protein [Candidatus Terasakiella magnetica]|uniref:Formyl transferase N-terminal domain-containing protein n=1 Tax=Candidatus Terasakiella magnetica TaxID=1867952 RepID=A0A1C3RKL9_9PROT|nr:formyltransferase family protein [Candidatus Terasakiella magnetica]SCA57870.1 conserved hypothetical protein [Candidatus Terasakiella magnetica]
MRTKPLKTVALLARQPGLNVLKDYLLHSKDIDLKCVFTHGKLPKAEGGETRDDFEVFQDLCKAHNIPLHAVDYPEAKDISPYLPEDEIDMMVSLSWRYLVPQHVLDRFKVGTTNLHRGYLPTYGGAEPVRRAIEAGETSVSITAHEMTIEIDGGDKLAEVHLPIAPCPSEQSPSDYAEVVKKQLEPLYPDLCNLAIKSWLARG